MIFKHHRHETRIVTKDEIPEQYRHLLIPNAVVFFVKAVFGAVLTQGIVAKEFSVWQHHFFVDQPCTLLASNDSPMVTINYMFEGSPYTKLSGHKLPLENGKYRMFYVPEIEQPVSFIDGSYHCVHIDYHLSILNDVIKGSTRLTYLFNTLIQEENKISPYESGDIDIRIRVRIAALLWDTGEDRERTAKENARRLILEYLLKHHSIRNDISILEKYIKNNLSENLDIETLSRFCGRSRTQLFKLFKVQYRKTPAQYIHEQRLEKAKFLIATTRVPIVQIAVIVGFNNISYFSKSFKKLFNVTPREYRQ